MKGFAIPMLALSVFAQQQPNGAAVNPPWTQAEVIHTSDLAKMLADKTAPHVFQVGFAVMYKSKHVPGSIHAGPARTAEGLENLKKAVADVPKDAEIVLYCGCCPWDHCPNMKPAYTLLHSLGYRHIQVVEIPQNFATDWIDKGYPVESGANVR